jgi:signal transduction histidine kinase
MKGPLRVLSVEDTESDFELLLLELRRSGYTPVTRRVQTAEEMSAALDQEEWDVVISDWSMPDFSAPAAMKVLQQKGIDLPFIIISGTVGERTAVEAMRAGAHDFMLKDNLTRLMPAVEREMREAKIRHERWRMQEQLMISDRMASVGVLAAGVAHEINNPLAAVLANLDLAARTTAELADLPQGERLQELKEELSDARESAERIRNIVRDLKLFSRSEDEKRGPVDVQRVIESSLRMAWNEVRHRAHIVKNYTMVPRVEANESRLGQVVLNLIVNAAQSIPEGRAEANEIRVGTLLGPGGRVVIEISDSGSGIPPDVLKRLFTPFFTTKPAGVGTGLGLSICQRIVTALGGEITVESTVGEGSTFRVALPAAPNAMADDPALLQAVPPPSRRGRILVVDDEPMIVNVVRRTLAKDHDVEVATTAREAMAKLDGQARYDIILCDLMMPDMTGMDLHEHVRKRWPEEAQRMIFLTGGAFTARARSFLDNVANLRLEKPFDTTALRAIVNDRVR